MNCCVVQQVIKYLLKNTLVNSAKRETMVDADVYLTGAVIFFHAFYHFVNEFNYIAPIVLWLNVT